MIKTKDNKYKETKRSAWTHITNGNKTYKKTNKTHKNDTTKLTKHIRRQTNSKSEAKHVLFCLSHTLVSSLKCKNRHANQMIS